MNELREKIEELNELISTNSQELQGHFYTSDFNKVLDAVIAALPFASADDEDGYIAAISEVTDLLQAAKENTP